MQTEEMRNEIETIQAALNASHPIIYEELDEVLGTSAEDEIQGLLQTLKSKCREKSLCTWSEWNAKSQRSLRGVASSGEPCGGLFDTMLSLEKYADHVKTLLTDVLAMKVDIQDQREQIQQEALMYSKISFDRTLFAHTHTHPSPPLFLICCVVFQFCTIVCFTPS